MNMKNIFILANMVQQDVDYLVIRIIEMKEDNKRFEVIKKVGEGSYGSVTQAFDHKVKAIRGVKKIKFLPTDVTIPVNAMREISCLQTVSHPNIIKLYEVIYEWQKAKMYLVLQYVPQNLYEHYHSEEDLPNSAIKSYIGQILRGLSELHKKGIMHRDLKPQNILVCSNGTIKICDFGQAKMTAVNYFCHSLHVSTLHYRAPEILAGSKYYSFGCDIWATGIIMWELFQRKSVFNTNSQISQLLEIFKITGTPTQQEFKSWKMLRRVQIPHFSKHPLQIRDLSPQGHNLLQKMLNLNPDKRISAYQALRHPYFDGYQ